MIPRTVRGRIIAHSLLVFLIIGGATFYTGLASAQLARGVVIFFRNNQLMADLRQTLGQTEAGLAGYLADKNSDSLKDYIRASTTLGEGGRRLNREIRPDESLLLQRDLAGLVDSYLEDAEASVNAKRGRDVKACAERYARAERDAELARQLITRIEGLSGAESLRSFSGFYAGIPLVLATHAVLVVSALGLSLTLLLLFAHRLTAPLARLAEAARAVGRGEYDHALPVAETDDEIGATAAAFAAMQANVRRAFLELREKSEVEARLMEERVRRLDLDRKLQAAELLALQTQINPHFLFNTLSAGLQLALSEGAERTGDFLENLAGFIRYALRPPSRRVTVGEEVESAERYIWLLRLRFQDRYRFRLEAAPEARPFRTPALLLQPLVENAVMHGLRDCEEGGEVRVGARLEEGRVVLEVADTGAGMTAEERDRALREEPAEAGPDQGGIGLRSVVRRVALATAGAGRVDLDSAPGRGTTVRILLPAEEGT